MIDTPVTQNIIGNDDDANGDSLTVDDFTVDGTTYQPGETATITGVGTITVTEAGDLTFTPETGYAGSVPDVDYTVIDGNGGSDTGTVTFTDIANQPPVATDDSVTGTTAMAVVVDVLGNDSDSNDDIDPTSVKLIDASGVEVTTLTVAGEGEWVVDAATGDVTFTPEGSFTGDPTPVEYVVSDTTGEKSAPATITVDYPTDAVDDSVSMQEDSDTISGNVLDNDKTGLTVTAIQIAGTDYSVGTAVDIPNVGTVQIDADGAYSFTPVEDYSGEVPDITYTVSDGTTTDTANLDIEVTAVADQPTTGSFELDPPGLVLNYQSWSNAKSVNGQNLLANKGSGASEEVLIGAIDDLRSGGVTANDDSTAVTDNGIITTTSLVATDLPEYDAVYISGYVFLEAGETYMYSGSGDDSASIVIGDNVSSLHVNWRGTNTSGNGEFDVTESGYYSFQFYAHNADGIGNYDFTIQNTDGTTEMKYYQDLSAIEGSLAGTSYILGDYDAGVDGSDDTGFYSVSRGYEGASADSIELIGINLQTTDTDGSEYLSFEMAGLPAGAILTFQDALGNEHSVTTDANGTASYTPTVSDAGTTEYSDFTLTVGDTIASSLDVSLVVTSTETLNGDSSTSTLDFEVEVTNASSSDDTIVFNADSTSMNGGDGTDTLLIDVDGTSIDFSNFNSSAFESLEVIDMTGNGTQALTNLTTSDVLEITNETVMTDKGLIINGDSADSVSLSGSDWTSAGTTTQDSNTYNVYSFADTDGTHELLIQTDITTTVL